jgi:hypothetical protein
MMYPKIGNVSVRCNGNLQENINWKQDECVPSTASIFLLSNKISPHSSIDKKNTLHKTRNSAEMNGTEASELLIRLKSCHFRKLTFWICFWDPSYKGQVWETCLKPCYSVALGMGFKVILSAKWLVCDNMGNIVGVHAGWTQLQPYPSPASLPCHSAFCMSGA